MTAPLVDRTSSPSSNTGSFNAAAGPVSPGATVPSYNQGGSQWNPTVAHVLVLVIVEMAVFAAIRYMFRKVM